MSAWGEPKRRDPLGGLLGLVLLFAALALPVCMVLWKLWIAAEVAQLHKIVTGL